MMAHGKLNDALHALNVVLVQARLQAFRRVPHEALAKVLDVAELLPMLIARADDTTAEFRTHLEDLVRIDPGFAQAVQRFDGDQGPSR